jgi:hypothetical protein
MHLKQIVSLLFLGILTGCAASGERPEDRSAEAESRWNDCIYEPSIRGYKVLDETNLIVDGSARKTYHVRLQRRALGLDSSLGIVFDASGTRVCAGFSEVVYRGHFDNRERVRIESIRLLTPEEEKDLLIEFGRLEPEIEQMPEPGEVEGPDIEELDQGASE